MGRMFGAICNVCGAPFVVHDGGGFAFDMLRCDTCGRERSVAHAEAGSLHAAYEKGWWEAHVDDDTQWPEHVNAYEGKSLTLDEYRSALSGVAGSCTCGGQFRTDASIRCPDCGEIDYEDDPNGSGLDYD